MSAINFGMDNDIIDYVGRLSGFKPVGRNLCLPLLVVRIITQTMSTCLRLHKLLSSPSCCCLVCRYGYSPLLLANQSLPVDVNYITALPGGDRLNQHCLNSFGEGLHVRDLYLFIIIPHCSLGLLKDTSTLLSCVMDSL